MPIYINQKNFTPEFEDTVVKPVLPQQKESIVWLSEGYQPEFEEDTQPIIDNAMNRDMSTEKDFSQDSSTSQPKGDFLEGLKRGYYGARGSLAGAGALIGGALEKYTSDAPVYEDGQWKRPEDATGTGKTLGATLMQSGIEEYTSMMDKASEHPAKYSFKDVYTGKAGFGGTIDYAQGIIGELIPSMAEAAVGGVIGTLTAPGPGSAVGAFGARTLLKKGIDKTVKEVIENQVKKGVFKEGSEVALKKAVTAQALKKLGGKLGLAGAVLPLEAGGAYAETLTQHKVNAPETALFFGALSASLEMFGGNARLVDSLVDGVAKGAKNRIKETARAIVTGAPEEMVQEAGQEFFQVLNTIVNTDEKLLTGENIDRIIESGGAGLIGGVAGGAVSQVGISKSDKQTISEPQHVPDVPTISEDAASPLPDTGTIPDTEIPQTTPEPRKEESGYKPFADLDKQMREGGIVPIDGEPVLQHQVESDKVNTEPTEAQKQAGNYKKDHIKIDGFDISIENPEGSIRKGVDKDGNVWSTEMVGHYGYIRKTKDSDGDPIDVFIKPGTDISPKVYVIDQVNPKTKEFDEHKVILGAESEQDATHLYLANYEDGWQGLGAITEMDSTEFKEWVKNNKKTRKPVAAAKPSGSVLIAQEKLGSEGTAYTNDNTPIRFKYAVMPLAQIKASHDTELRINPKYPAELQPRDRTRAASLSQIRTIAKNLNPVKIAESTSVSSGAPIVLPDGTVLSGNGRIIALNIAYAQHKDKGQSYKDFLIHNKDKFGIKEVNDGDVLVRIVDPQSIGDINQFVQKANESETARMSASEQAMADAGNFTEEDIASFHPSEYGDITTATNKIFLEKFVSKMSPEEKAGLLSDKGEATRQLVDRVQAAIFHKAYNSDFLLKLMAESVNSEMKNILNGLQVGAVEFVKAKNLNADIAKKVTDTLIDGIKFVRQAQKEYPDMAGGSGRTKTQVQVAHAIAQKSLFENDVAYNVQRIAIEIADKIRSGKKIGHYIKTIGKFLKEGLSEINQQSMFGDKEPVDTPTILNKTKSAISAAEQQEIDNAKGTTNTEETFTGTSEPVYYRDNRQNDKGDGRRPGGRQAQISGTHGAAAQINEKDLFNPDKGKSEDLAKVNESTPVFSTTEDFKWSNEMIAESLLLSEDKIPPVFISKKIEKIFQQYEKSESKDEFIKDVDKLYQSILTQRVLKDRKMMSTNRVRGADFIREKLLNAKRNGWLTDESVDLAEWFIQQNPILLEDAAISIKSDKKEIGARGQYSPILRIITLFKNQADVRTPIHEILHHLERLMPIELQNAIITEWFKHIKGIFKNTSDKHVREYIETVIWANTVGTTVAFEKAHSILQKYKLRDQYYQYISPSEFWAENGSRILSERYNAKNSIWKRIYQWTKEAINKIKSFLGIKSDAPVIIAMNVLIKNIEDGTIKGTAEDLAKVNKRTPVFSINDSQLSTDTLPGEGVSIADIQKRFVGQSISISPDNKIHVGLKNGKQLTIESVRKISDSDIEFAIKTGRMSKDGVVLGKYQDGKITLNKDMATKGTIDHETYHFLVDSEILTANDRLQVRAQALRYKKAGKFNYKWNTNIEENEANAFAQFLSERESFSDTTLGTILQKIVDFLDALLYVGRQSMRKIARQVEAGKIYERKVANGMNPKDASFQATAETFYSQMKEVLEKKITQSYDVGTLKKKISEWAKKGEIKQEEFEWSGLSEWLDSQEGKVSPTDILNFLQENEIKLETTIFKDKNFWYVLDSEDTEPSEFDTRQEAEQYVKERQEEEDFDPERFKIEFQVGEETGRFFASVLPGGTNYEEIVLSFNDDWNADLDYKSQHYPEVSNVLLHVRKNDRRDTNDKSVLFLETVQSDWHQAGRKQGYETPEIENRLEEVDAQLSNLLRLNVQEMKLAKVPMNTAMADFRDISNLNSVEKKKVQDIQRIISMRRNIFNNKNTKVLNDQETQEWIDLIGKTQPASATLIGAIDERNKLERSTNIPDAPFKKTWPLLAIKKMVRQAAENNKEYLAWTPGWVQEKRWKIGGLTNFQWRKNKNGKVSFSAETISETRVPLESTTDANLIKAIQKNTDVMAEIENAPNNSSGQLSLEQERQLDTGLVSFYDKIIPAAVNKFFNKKLFGNAKVTQIEIPVEGKPLKVWALPVTPEIKQKALYEGMPLFSTSEGVAQDNNKEYKGDYFLRFTKNKNAKGRTSYDQIKDKMFKGVSSYNITNAIRKYMEQGYGFDEAIYVFVRKQADYDSRFVNNYDGQFVVFEGTEQEKDGNNNEDFQGNDAVAATIDDYVLYGRIEPGKYGWVIKEENWTDRFPEFQKKQPLFSTSDDIIKEKFYFEPSFKEKIKNVTDQLSIDRVIAETFDHLHFIKVRLNDESYQLHRRNTGISSITFNTWLQHGGLKIHDDGKSFIVTGKNEGVLPFLKKLGKEDANKLNYWVSAKRAELLEKEGREKWLDKNARDKIFQHTGDKAVDGRTWAALNIQFQRYNNNIVDIAVQAGLISPEARKEWESDMYISFNRVIEKAGSIDVFNVGPRKNKQHISAQIKRLKGGEAKIDPLTNIVRNWMFMLDSSARNMARAKAFEYGSALYVGRAYWEVTNTNDPNMIKQFETEEEAQKWVDQQTVVGQSPYKITGKNKPLLEEVSKAQLTNIVGVQKVVEWAVKKGIRTKIKFPTQEEAQEWVKQHNGVVMPSGQKKIAQQQSLKDIYTLEKRQNTVIRFGKMKDHNILSFQRDGKPVYFTTQDVDLFNALSELNIESLNNNLLKSAAWFKRILTFGVTRTPAFAVNNLIRDTVHTGVIDKDFIPVYDTIKGMVKIFAQDAEAREFAASGWAFGASYIKDNSPESIRKQLNKVLDIDKKGAINFILNSPKKIWQLYDFVLESGENASRLGLYTRKKEKGMSPFEAGFVARDIMDFSMRGANQSVGILIRVYPFLNARMQGLYRLGKALNPKTNPDFKYVAVKGMLYAGATLLIWSLFKDDDRYKELDDYAKWNFHHFWIGNIHVQIPKAFEVGQVFGSLPEVVADIINGEEEGKYFWKWFKSTLVNTFALDYMPQPIRPIEEIRNNKEKFTGRQIIPDGLEDIEPFLQYTDRTSYTAREFMTKLNKINPDINISPIHFDHIVRGYLGTLGSIMLAATDVTVQRLGDYPEKPAGEHMPWDIGLINRPATSTKYVTRFYELQKEINTLYSTLNQIYIDTAKNILLEGFSGDYTELLSRKKGESKKDYNKRLEAQLEKVNVAPDMIDYIKDRQEEIFGKQKIDTIPENELAVTAIGLLKGRKKVANKARNLLAEKNKEIREVMRARYLNAEQKGEKLKQLRQEKTDLAKELFTIMRKQKEGEEQ